MNGGTGDRWGKVRQQYERNRYLSKEDISWIEQRRSALESCLWQVGLDGRPKILPASKIRSGLLDRLVEVLLEQELRRSSPDRMTATFRADQLLKRVSEGKSFTDLSRKCALPDIGFYKFGESKYLSASLKLGQFLIKPASAYNDPSLTVAQKDNELENWSILRGQTMMVQIHGKTSAGEPVTIGPEQGVRTMAGHTMPNFYVWCCARRYDARMFSEFGYDSVLIVRKPDVFEERLLDSVNRLRPDLVGISKPVQYYDPFFTDIKTLEKGFSKSIEYSYQQEGRFIWRTSATKIFEQFFVELGSLEDIAELVTR